MSNTQHQNSSTTKLVFALKSKQRADQELVLSKKKSTLGSHKDCTVVLNSDQIQPMHCMVIQGQRGTIVRNFHPDTRINGESFGDAWLGEGDSISIGNVDLLNRVNISNNQLAQANNQIVRDSGPASCQVAPHQSEAMFELVERLTKMEGVLDHLNEINQTNRSRTRRVIKSLRDKSRASEHQLSKNLEEVNHLEAANTALLNELELLRKESVSRGELQRLADTINQNSDHIEKLVSSKDATIIQFAEKNSVLAAELNSIRSQMENAATPNTQSFCPPENDFESASDQLEQVTSESDDAPQTGAPSIEAAVPFLNQTLSDEPAAEDNFDFAQNDEVNVDPNLPAVESACDHSQDMPVDESEYLNIDSFNVDAFGTEKAEEAESTPEEFDTEFSSDSFNPEAFTAESDSKGSTVGEEKSSDVETSETNPIGLDAFANEFDVSPGSAKQAEDDADQKPAVDPFQVLSMLDNARSEFEASDATGEFSELDEQLSGLSDLTAPDKEPAENWLTDGSTENGVCENGITEQEIVADSAAELPQQMPDQFQPISEELNEQFEAEAFDEQRSETQPIEKAEVSTSEPPQRDELTAPFDNTAKFEDPEAEKPNHLDFEDPEMGSDDLAALQSRLDDLVGHQLGTDQSNEESTDVGHELASETEPSFNTSDFLKEFEKIDDQVSQEFQQETPLDFESVDVTTPLENSTPESSNVDAETSDEIEFNFELAESNLTGAFADFQKGSEDNDDESSFSNETELQYSEDLDSGNENSATEISSEFEYSAGESEQSDEDETADDSNPYAAFLNKQQDEASATRNESDNVSQTVGPESKLEENPEGTTGLSTAHLFEQFNQLQESEETSPLSGRLFDETSSVQKDENDSGSLEQLPPTVQPDNTSNKSDEMDSEESYIHDYMQRLLGNSEVKPEEPEPSETSDAPSLLEQTFEEEIRERQEMLKPSEFVPKASAPERKSNLQAMRELANQSAKSALAVSSQKRKFEQQSTLVLIATGVCFFLGAISAMFITQAICIPTLFSVIFFSLTGFGVFYFYDLKNPRKTAKKTAEQTGKNTSQTEAAATPSSASQTKISDVPTQKTELAASDSQPRDSQPREDTTE